MNTRQYTDRYTAKRLLRTPVYQDVHARHAAQVTEMADALRKRNAEISMLKKNLADAEGTIEKRDAEIAMLKPKKTAA